MLDLTKPVETRDGRKVRILCIDAKGSYPVVGLVSYENDPTEVAETWTLTGAYGEDGVKPLDLFNIPKEHTVWINFYENDSDTYLHTSKEDAIVNGRDSFGNDQRAACKKITYKIGDFDE